MQRTIADTLVTIETDRITGAIDAKMDAYLGGERVVFDEAVDLSDFTSFQQRVLAAIRGIPYGETVTYSELAEFVHSQKLQKSFEYSEIAEQVGKPNAVRAVANACGVNPVPIVIPCHRVVAKDGIGGYSSGVAVKKRLLQLESAI